MDKSWKSKCKSASHKAFKDKAKHRVDDLQAVFFDLQFARKESRSLDMSLLEEQLHQMLREWKAELNDPSPPSSLQLGGTPGSFSLDICRLLQLCEEENDDATSPLAPPKPEPDDQTFQLGPTLVLHEGFGMNLVQHQEHGFTAVDCKNSAAKMCNLEGASHLDYPQSQFEMQQELGQRSFYAGDNSLPQFSSYLPSICPPPSAFLGPKCALWDCPRPAQGSAWYQDYCSSFHATLALNEGPPGMGPVLRPWGIGLKDGLLFAALSAKAQGKGVGVPECEGAATAKSPWNATELFDLSMLEGETIREWLFFDKPRRAFESGNRKQRSLPDYSGRGWHESRKQVMNEFGGLKRSYYMDPQPLSHIEWHLYEYEINKCDACALYRLELKLVDGKKSSKGKITNDSVSDIHKTSLDDKRSAKGNAGNGYAVATNRLGAPYDYLGDNTIEYFLT